jgi:hypothetical protein
MKTMKLILAIVMVCLISGVMAQTGKPAATKKNYYFVMATHTPEQCQTNLDELKGKGDSFVSKFYFGCHHGDHTSYAILQGTSEDAVRKSLPKVEQDVAKIIPVDKMTMDQLQKAHKDMK